MSSRRCPPATRRPGGTMAGRAGGMGDPGNGGAAKGADMIATGATGATWLMGMLITYTAVSEETGGEYMIWEGLAPPQHGAPPHIHHRETEAFYVLEGLFDIVRGEHAVRAGAGDYVHVPKA